MHDIYDSPIGELHKYRDLVDTDIRRLYNEDKEFRQHCCIDNHYEIRVQSTLAIFDFSKQPLGGKYKSLVLDIDKKFVLSTQSTRQIINTIYLTIALGGHYFQRLVAKELKQKYRNVISLGYSAFFSLKGHSTGNTHWIALHWMKDYEYSVATKAITFISLKVGGIRFRITLSGAGKGIGARIHDSIHHNRTVRKIVTQFVNDAWNCQLMPSQNSIRSLIYKEDLYCRKTIRLLWKMPELVEFLFGAYIKRTHQHLLMEYGIEYLDADHKELTRKVKRNRYNY